MTAPTSDPTFASLRFSFLVPLLHRWIDTRVLDFLTATWFLCSLQCDYCVWQVVGKKKNQQQRNKMVETVVRLYPCRFGRAGEMSVPVPWPPPPTSQSLFHYSLAKTRQWRGPSPRGTSERTQRNERRETREPIENREPKRDEKKTKRGAEGSDSRIELLLREKFKKAPVNRRHG